MTRWISVVPLACIACGPASTVDVPGWDTVSPQEALEWLDTDVQFVDARSESAYTESHLPGAVSLPAGDLRATVGEVDGQVAPRADVEALLEDAGLDSDRPMVVYGASNDTGTARTLWTLALYGANGGLRLLDGGVEAWTSSLEATAPTDTATTWEGAPTREELRVDIDWMIEHLDDDDVAIYDVRTGAEFAAGHVPGSRNVDWTSNLDSNGLFLDPDGVLALHGDPSNTTVVVYCQSGSRASVSWALLTAAGLSDVRVYDGSWNEWGADPTTPKETGEGAW